MSTPVERFAASIRAIQREIDALPAEAVAALQGEIATLRMQVAMELASLPLLGVSSARLQQLEDELRYLAERFTERYIVGTAALMNDAAQAGAALAARPLVEAGLMFHVPQISRRQIEAVRLYQASLIRNVATETVQAISRDLRLALLRGEGVPEVLGRVAGRLPSSGAFGALATRAEAITRTELGRIQAIAGQASLEDAQRFVPDLQKEWQHSGNTGPYRRLGHVMAAGQIRDVGAAFRIRPEPGKPYEALLYPRDPAGTPGNTIFCGCVSVPYRATWRLEIEAANQEQAAFETRRLRSNAFQEAA